MLRIGYTQTEIAQNVGCSVSSVQRRNKIIQPQTIGNDPIKSILESTILAVFDLFSIVSILFEFEAFRECAPYEINSRLYPFIGDLFEMNLNLAKTILDRSEYSNQVIGLVDINPSILNDRSKDYT